MPAAEPYAYMPICLYPYMPICLYAYMPICLYDSSRTLSLRLSLSLMT